MQVTNHFLDAELERLLGNISFAFPSNLIPTNSAIVAVPSFSPSSLPSALRSVPSRILTPSPINKTKMKTEFLLLGI